LTPIISKSNPDIIVLFQVINSCSLSRHCFEREELIIVADHVIESVKDLAEQVKLYKITTIDPAQQSQG